MAFAVGLVNKSISVLSGKSDLYNTIKRERCLVAVAQGQMPSLESSWNITGQAYCIEVTTEGVSGCSRIDFKDVRQPPSLHFSFSSSLLSVLFFISFLLSTSYRSYFLWRSSHTSKRQENWDPAYIWSVGHFQLQPWICFKWIHGPGVPPVWPLERGRDALPG